MLNRNYSRFFFLRKSKLIFTIIIFTNPLIVDAQIKWMNVDDLYKVGKGIHVFKSEGSFDGSPFIGYYVSVDMHQRKNDFFIDTTLGRRLTPLKFFEKNNSPEIVMNCSFFEFKQNRNVNLIVQNGKMIGFDTPAVSRKGKDTLTFAHHFGSAFGVSKSGKMNIVFNYNDSSLKYPLYSEEAILPFIDSFQKVSISNPLITSLKKWKPAFAFGGGPSLIQDNKLRITNNEERKFAGKAIADKHPRTAIGYTANEQMILLVVQGRMKNIADGATLPQLGELMLQLNCVEAMNLDGGGSSCLLINGLETIKPSDPECQRPVPAVLIIK